MLTSMTNTIMNATYQYYSMLRILHQCSVINIHANNLHLWHWSNIDEKHLSFKNTKLYSAFVFFSKNLLHQFEIFWLLHCCSSSFRIDNNCSQEKTYSTFYLHLCTYTSFCTLTSSFMHLHIFLCTLHESFLISLKR